jgi:hypothetical protein
MAHETPEEQALARTYRQAAKGDAYHERKSGGAPAPGGYDPTMGVTHERPDVPLSDVVHPDKADGENHDAPPSAKGPDHDRLMRGLEPGETSADG